MQQGLEALRSISVTEMRLRFAFLVFALPGIYALPVGAATPACGTVLTSNTTLDSDMNCPDRAILFNGPQSKNVALDCDGFSISTASDRIVSANFVSGITISNCVLSTTHNDGRGIVLTGVSGSKFTANTITTTGNGSSAFDIRGESSSNLISNNTVYTSGANSNAIRIRTGSNKNTVKGNVFQAESSYAVSIQSAEKNELIKNTLISPDGFLNQARFSLQNGGITVDAAGNIFAVENNWGSSAPDGAGIGVATAFFQIDPNTGAAMSAIPLLRGGVDVGFGFDALEILPNGRVLALRGCCTDSYLFEINPVSGEVSEIPLNLPPGLQGSLNGLEAIDNFNLLATTNQGNLIDIDLVAGTASLVGDQERGWTGIAIHPNTSQVFTVSRGRIEASNTAHLYEIDINNGQVIEDIGDTGIQSISGLDFAPVGILYGNYNLEIIDINTGLATTVGDYGPDPLEPLAKKNYLQDNLLKNAFGSLRFPGKIVLPSLEQVDMSAQRVSIMDNEVKVESALLPFLDEPARIVLQSLPGTYRNLLVDPEDDGTFVPCKASKCKFVSFTGGPLVFDVKGFTTYSSEENADPSMHFVTSTLHAEIKALLSGSGLSGSIKKKLKSAGKKIAKAAGFLNKGKVKKGFTEMSKTAKDLYKVIAKLPSASFLLDRLVAAAKNEAQDAIDSANLAMGDAALIASAEAKMVDAQNLLDLDKPDKAINAYQKAWQNAQKAEK